MAADPTSEEPSARLSAVFGRPFPEQLAFFRAKLAHQVTTHHWTDVWKSEHDSAFMVAGAAKADLLSAFATATDDALFGGGNLETFRKDFDAIVAKHGWSYTGSRNWRTRVIYNTNAATSYAAGRLAQLRANGFGYWIYRHMDGELHPRPLHESWDGLTLPADHPWWHTHYPPGGWGCRCYVIGTRNPDSAKILGGRVVKRPPDDGINPATGEPNGIDRGWGYMTGDTVSDKARIIADKLRALPAPLGAAMLGSWTDAQIDGLTHAFGTWVDGIINDGVSRGASFVAGAIESPIIGRLVDRGVAPQTAEILVRDKDVLHAFRSGKHNAVALNWFRSLPSLLRSPSAVILDTTHESPALLFIYDAPADARHKLVLQLDYQLKTRTSNVLNTATVVKNSDLRKPGYEVIDGQI